MGRIIAFDVGDKRVGVAVSDPFGWTAQGLTTLTRTGNLEKDVQLLLGVAEKYEDVTLLFGLPKNMDGTEGPQAKKVRAFAKAVVKAKEYPLVFWDERLSTVAATHVLMDVKDWRERRKVVDKVAASVILQSYLDSDPKL